MVRTAYADAWMVDVTARELLDLAGGAPAYGAGLRQPEKRLIFAVLEDAVCTFQKYIALRRGTPRHFRQVEGWLASNDTEWAFSFVNICEALDLDVGRCRAGLARWRHRQEAGDGPTIIVGPRLLRVDGRGRLRAEGGRPGSEPRAIAAPYRLRRGPRPR